MKKVVTIMFVLILIIALQACQLAKGEETPRTEIEDENRLSGMYFQILSYDSQGLYISVLPEFDESDKVYIEHVVYDYHGNPTERLDASSNLVNIHTSTNILSHTIDGITTHTRHNIFTFEMILGNMHNGNILQMHIIKTDGVNSILEQGQGYSLSHLSTMSTRFDDDYIKNNVVYKTSFEIKVRMIDTLKSVNIIEFDRGHNVQKSTSSTVPIKTYIPMQTTAYIIIEEVFEDLQGEEYIKRTIYNNDKNHYVQLYFLDSLGIVNQNNTMEIRFIIS